MADTGERVKWSNLERVELEDMDAVSTVQQANLARLQGGLLDNFNTANAMARGGLLSRLNYDGTTPTAVTFGFMRIAFIPEGATELDAGLGQAFDYDRTLAWQATYSTASLNLSAGVVGGNRPFIWARRVEVDAEEATRRFWDELTELEYTDGVFTRVREVVELGLSNGGDANPPSAGNWVRIARLVSTGAEVVLSPRHVLDGHDAVYEASATNEDRGSVVRFYPDEPMIDFTRAPALPELTRMLLASLCKVQDGRHAFNEKFRLAGAPIAGLRSWFYGILDPTFRGLKQLQEELDNIFPCPRVAYIGRLTYNATGTPHYDLEVVHDAGIVTIAVSDGIGMAWGDAGIRTRITVTPGTDVEVHAVHVDILAFSGGGSGNNYPLSGGYEYAVCAHANEVELPATDPFNVDIGAWDPTEADAVDRPTIANKYEFIVLATGIAP